MKYDTSSYDNVVLYHKGCNDGIASAAAAADKFGHDAIYIPYQYGEPLPDLTDKTVYVLDLSLPPETIEELYDVVDAMVIVDHHKTAIDSLGYLPKVSSHVQFMNNALSSDFERIYVMLDSNLSGSVLSWMFFNDVVSGEGQDKDLSDLLYLLPPIYLHINDYDLYKFELPNTREISAWLSNGVRSIKRFRTMSNEQGHVIDSVIKAGRMLVDYDTSIIKSIIKNYTQSFVVRGIKVCVLNAPHHLRNEIADVLLNDESVGCQVVVLYTRRDNKTIVSLRACNEFDTTIVTTAFGGGGHVNASACKLDTPDVPLDIQSMFGPVSFWVRLKAAWKVLRGNYHHNS